MEARSLWPSLSFQLMLECCKSESCYKLNQKSAEFANLLANKFKVKKYVNKLKKLLM